MASPNDVLILKIFVIDGRGFSFNETQALNLSCSFGSVTLETPYSISRESHIWNSELKWKVTRQQLRKLSSGGSQCKLYVKQRGEEKPLGWFILDTRKAKLNSHYMDPASEGEWFSIIGGDKVALTKTGETPQVRIKYTLTEESTNVVGETISSDPPAKPLKAKEQPAPSAIAATAATGPSSSSYSSGFDQSDALEEDDGGEVQQRDDEHQATAESQPTARAQQESLKSCSDECRSSPSPQSTHRDDDNQLLSDPAVKDRSTQPSNLPPPPPPPINPFLSPNPADGPFRLFGLNIDVSSFHAASRSHFPLNLAQVYIQASLPSLLIDLMNARGHRLASRMNPLKSFPPVNVQRGGQGLIPNGSGAVEFTAGVMELARMLGSDPRLNVEVWHQERFKADTLLGVASIPLAHLLSDCVVKGSAPVMALMVKGRGGEEEVEVEVEVGKIGTVIRLEDKGPVLMPEPLVNKNQPTYPSLGISPPPPPPSLPPAQDNGLAALISSFPAPSEYQAAYEVEMWKKREEMRWRDELKERESLRMSTLEGEWRAREKKREQEVQALKDEVRSIEMRAKKVIVEVEERERRLLMAEEGVIRRKKEMEREHLHRMNEAEAAVRRLQVECEHQLEIERDRCSEVTRQRQALIDRLSVQETRYASLEKAFQSFRDSHRISRESELDRELDRVKHDLSSCEEKYQQAMNVQLSYKAQMTRLVEELARAHKKVQSVARISEEARVMEGREEEEEGGERGKVRKGSNIDFIRKQGQEISEVRRQISSLKEAASRPPPPPSPIPPPQPIPQPQLVGIVEPSTSAASDSAPSPPVPPSPSKAAPTLLPPTSPNLNEVSRLERRKEELIASGAYEPNDPLIARIDERIKELSKQ